MAALQGEAAAGECELRFLMVNSNSFHLRFAQTTTIREVKAALISRRPPELMDFLQNSSPSSPPPSKTEELRILHLGRFLEDVKTLQECSIPSTPGNVTTVHISCRVSSTVLDDVKGKLDKKNGGCCRIV